MSQKSKTPGAQGDHVFESSFENSPQPLATSSVNRAKQTQLLQHPVTKASKSKQTTAAARKDAAEISALQKKINEIKASNKNGPTKLNDQKQKDILEQLEEIQHSLDEKYRRLSNNVKSKAKPAKGNNTLWLLQHPVTKASKSKQTTTAARKDAAEISALQKKINEIKASNKNVGGDTIGNNTRAIMQRYEDDRDSICTSVSSVMSTSQLARILEQHSDMESQSELFQEFLQEVSSKNSSKKSSQRSSPSKCSDRSVRYDPQNVRNYPQNNRNDHQTAENDPRNTRNGVHSQHNMGNGHLNMENDPDDLSSDAYNMENNPRRKGNGRHNTDVDPYSTGN
ncbi:uncharacterized protein LOC113466927 [Diaphorina citri]|uniref:Uncharacterized protein LOC113466927 n=1 Tax=Diaphorina citri TaxID=121845 RepID=A0A3Q0IQH4_DIACI|nr:uncharacterized protein LOC113466927 [Diaphorina citri]